MGYNFTIRSTLRLGHNDPYERRTNDFLPSYVTVKKSFVRRS